MKRVLAVLVVTLSCNGGEAEPPQLDTQAPTGFEPPIVTNAEPPVAYPVAEFEARTEGTVVLRLFIDSTGAVDPDSTMIAESSGNTALDSAALQGVPAMNFAPAREDGVPVATIFLQPVHFRLPDNTGSEQ